MERNPSRSVASRFAFVVCQNWNNKLKLCKSNYTCKMTKSQSYNAIKDLIQSRFCENLSQPHHGCQSKNPYHAVWRGQMQWWGKWNGARFSILCLFNANFALFCPRFNLIADTAAVPHPKGGVAQVVEVKKMHVLVWPLWIVCLTMVRTVLESSFWVPKLF